MYIYYLISLLHCKCCMKEDFVFFYKKFINNLYIGIICSFYIACLCSESGSLSSICDKQTGKCSCKENVEGNKCDKIGDNFYFPSFGQIEFTAADIIPYARYDLMDGFFDGVSVNETFASAKLSFNISITKKYYLAVYYALLEKRRSTIKFDLSSGGINYVQSQQTNKYL